MHPPCRHLAVPIILSIGILVGCAPEETVPASVVPHQAALTESWRISTGFEKPESVVYDAARYMIYVSSIGSDFAAKDGSGYISRISPHGHFLDSIWVSGLNAPKGLALHGDLLYVSVVDELIAIDTNSGEIVEQRPAEGAQFLNDVAVDASGNVYMSDSATNTIYRLREGELAPFVSGGQLSSPNGVYALPDALIIAAADSASQEPGRERYLKRVDYATRTVEPLGDVTPLGAIDGVEPDGHGGYFLTDWAGGTVSRWTPDVGIVVLQELEQGTADLTYVESESMIYLPLMMSGQLVAYNVRWQ